MVKKLNDKAEALDKETTLRDRLLQAWREKFSLQKELAEALKRETRLQKELAKILKGLDSIVKTSNL